jgi:endosialidase-like protein
MPVSETCARGILVSTRWSDFCEAVGMKMKIPSIRIVLTIVFFGLLPKAHAVSPAPDGGYPGGNTAEGQAALLNLTTGGFNTAVGYLSLRSNTTGSFNTGVGAGTLFVNTADENTATGTGALFSNTAGSSNTANGAFALFSNTTGPFNTATGINALRSNTAGNGNTATGFNALISNTIGNSNSALGSDALELNTGSTNTAIGVEALQNNTTGSGNIALGYRAGMNITTASNVICIGTDGNNVDNACYIGQIFGATSSGGTAVVVNMNGRLGTVTSSRRFKEEIKPMDKASEALFALKPVAFRYKKDIDPAGIPQLGLVAEDVEKVNSDLVVRDEKGKPYSVRYDQVNAMLLNEFLKEHRKVQKLEATVADLVAELRQVKAQVQMNSPILRVAAGNP